jgi:hypothetical protein
MGLLKSSWGDYKYGRIVGIALLVIVVLGTYTFFATGAHQQGGNWKEELKSFALEGAGFFRTLLIAAIIVAPLVIQGMLGLYDKTNAMIWSTSLAVLALGGFATTLSVKGALNLAWFFNGILLFFTVVRKDNPVQYSTAWLMFGLTSTVIGPGTSIISNAELSPGWVYFSIFGAAFTGAMKKIGEAFGGEVYKRIKTRLKSLWDKAFGIAEKGKKVNEALQNTEKERDAAKDAEKAVDKAEAAINKNDAPAIAVAAQQVQTTVQTASQIPAMQGFEFKPFLDVIQQQIDLQGQTTNRLLDIIQNKDKFSKTDIGRAQAYLYELGRRFLQEMTDRKSNWEEYERLRKQNFKEVADKLRAVRNKRLISYANFLEKDAQRIGIKTFIGLTVRWIREINKDREHLGDTVEDEFKKLERSGREIKAIVEKIDGEAKVMSDQTKQLQTYDAQVRVYYGEILDAIKELNKVDAPQKIIKDMREKLRWIISYLPQKEKSLIQARKNLTKIENLMEEADHYINANAHVAARVEETNESLGSPVEAVTK